MGSEAAQQPEGGEGGELPAPIAVATAAAAASESATEEQGQARRESEDLNPVSLADLFAKDPECAAVKNKDKKPGRSMLFAGAKLDDELELKKLQVFVRIRPSVTGGAPRWDAENCIHATSKYSIAIAPPEGSQAYKSGDRGQTYSFSRVFDADTSQQDYFDNTTAPLVHDLLRNKQHNSVMMAYGITAAGKTYTIEGTREQPGVMPRSLTLLFEGLASHVDPISARASYYEVYNEQIYDLLDEQGVGPLGQRAALKLKEDAMGRVFVAGLCEVEVGSANDALAVLRRGSRQRQRAETGLNYSSSRSHSIFTITLYQRNPDEQGPAADASSGEAEEGAGGGEERLGRMSFVDLAGSERAQRTGNVGVRLKESVAINSSLMTLGRCLEALRWNQQHKGSSNLRVVPYRESKVTHLFRDALHGWGQVVLSVNVSPVSRDYDETAHVLKYAALATQIGTIQQAEAPRRTIKAVSPAIRKVKRKAALPPEARGQGVPAGRAKKAKKEAGGHDATEDQAAADPGAAELSMEPFGSAEPEPEAADGHPAAPVLPRSQSASFADEGAGQQQPAVLGAQQEGQAEETACKCARSAAGEARSGRLSLGAQLDEVAEEGDEEGHEEGVDADEFAATPVTPADGEEDEAVAALQAQVQALIGDLQKAEERCVLLEAEVREEVAEEMAQLLRDMEESYRLRLQAEVEAMDRRQAAAGSTTAAEAGRRGKATGSKALAPVAQPDSAADLAAAREEAAAAAVEAQQARQQADSLSAELQEVQQQLAAAQAEVQHREQEQAAMAERVAELEASLAAAEQEAASAAVQLASEREWSAGLQAGLDSARQQVDEAQACLAAERQRAAELEVELTGARGQAEQLRCELLTVQGQAGQLESELAAVREAADSDQQQASEQYEAQLQEAVTQIEANKCMELEMAEEQAERLRKENLALQQRLQAALAALAACGSPLTGPASLAARMAQAAPEGNGRGAGGTPHDVALARARQAAAADEAAAAAAAAAAAGGTSGLPRSRSRFAEEASAPLSLAEGAETLAPAAGLQPVAEEAAEEECQQQQGQENEQRQQAKHEPKPRAGRGRPRKAVAFAEAEPPAAAQPEEQQQAAPPARESSRARRMTRAGAAADARLAAQALAAEAAHEQEQATKPKRRQRGQAAAAGVTQGDMGQLVDSMAQGEATAGGAEHVQPAKGEQQQHEQVPESSSSQAVLHASPAELRPGRKGRAPAACRSMDDDLPLIGSVNLEHLPDQLAAAGSRHEQQPSLGDAAIPAQQPRRRGRPVGNKENKSGGAANSRLPAVPETEAAEAGEQQEQAGATVEQPPAHPQQQRGSSKRKRLLPSQPMSAEMRSALGEDLSLRQMVAQKQQQQQSADAAGDGAAGGGRRSRRQTQFLRL